MIGWAPPFCAAATTCALFSRPRSCQLLGVGGSRPLRPSRAKFRRRECRLDRVCRPQMQPVRRREIEEGQKSVAILLQRLHRLGVLRPELVRELPHHLLGHRLFVRLHDPVEHLLAPLLRPPRLLACPIPVLDGHQFLRPIRQNPQDHQGAQPVVLKTNRKMHPVHPDVDEILPGKIPAPPGSVLVRPRLLQADDVGRGQPRRILSQQRSSPAGTGRNRSGPQGPGPPRPADRGASPENSRSPIPARRRSSDGHPQGPIRPGLSEIVGVRLHFPRQSCSNVPSAYPPCQLSRAGVHWLLTNEGTPTSFHLPYTTFGYSSFRSASAR